MFIREFVFHKKSICYSFKKIHSIRISKINSITILLFIMILFGCDFPQYSKNDLVCHPKEKFKKNIIATEYFDIATFIPHKIKKTKVLNIYIEGDGNAWASKNKYSDNPTPINPIGYYLAAAHNNDDVAYIARPCQYVAINHNKNCSYKYWTYARFAKEVIDSMNEAVSVLKREFKAENIILIGYSGGGAIAALIAARRIDVLGFITIAGNLNHEKWTRYHQVSKLSESINPVDFIEPLARLSQVHLIGNNDKIMPSLVLDSYTSLLRNETNLKIISYDNFDHHCCWVENWQNIYPSVIAYLNND